jgi:hypothetical protein
VHRPRCWGWGAGVRNYPLRPADVAALAVHVMINTALTGATFDLDGGRLLVPSG